MKNEMTNKEIRLMCEEIQKKYSDMKWKFMVTQKGDDIRIWWEYLNYIGCKKPWWTIAADEDSNGYTVRNEYYEFQDWTDNLKKAVQRVAFNLVMKY